MELRLSFTCPLASGLHARPAGLIADTARKYASTVVMTHVPTGQTVNARSTLAIVSADVRHGDTCILTITGGDAQRVHDALSVIVNETFPSLVEEVPDISDDSLAEPPRSFLDLGVPCVQGRAVSKGIGRGVVVMACRSGLPSSESEDEPGTRQDEEEDLRSAVDRVCEAITAETRNAPKGMRSEILEAHLSIARDEDMLAEAFEHIEAGVSASRSVVRAAESFMRKLSESDSAYIRQRVVDVEDVACRILGELGVLADADAEIDLQEPSVVVAPDLSPRQFLGMNRDQLSAVVLDNAGDTSHVVILARSMGIPVLTDVVGASTAFSPGDDVIVDAYLGFAVRASEPGVVGYFDQEINKHERRQKREKEYADLEAKTRDGVRLDVAMNVSFPADLQSEHTGYADGIGLLRTELAFSIQEAEPTEDQQYRLFVEALDALRAKPVLVRMFDVGADKPLPYMPLPEEPNPALGCRGVRNYSSYRKGIHSQIRAILRASAHGPIWLMIPMVSRVEEIVEVRHWIEGVQSELREEGIAFDPAMKIGIMVEVPLIAFAMPDVCELVDFISIGTNDLSQYFSAADRCNASVNDLSAVRHPAFLRVLDSIMQVARKKSCYVGMCGDMASDTRNLPLLLGLGLQEVSVIAPELAHIRSAVRKYSRADCRELLDSCLACRTIEEVEEQLDHFSAGSGVSELLDPELIVIDGDDSSKADAIKRLLDELYVTGRTDRPECVEEAIWAREAECTTGLGHGFAIPHCKSQAVLQSSVAVLRLREPIEWGSVDEKPVGCVILLAMSGTDQQRTHMRVFSTLARRLMHEDFRETMLAADTADALYTYLKQELESEPT